VAWYARGVIDATDPLAAEVHARRLAQLEPLGPLGPLALAVLIAACGGPGRAPSRPAPDRSSRPAAALPAAPTGAVIRLAHDQLRFDDRVLCEGPPDVDSDVAGLPRGCAEGTQIPALVAALNVANADHAREPVVIVDADVTTAALDAVLVSLGLGQWDDYGLELAGARRRHITNRGGDPAKVVTVTFRHGRFVVATRMAVGPRCALAPASHPLADVPGCAAAIAAQHPALVGIYVGDAEVSELAALLAALDDGLAISIAPI
jgi:hypothetical protein